MATIAEGAETEDPVRVLRALACDEAQGYDLGRPAPAASLDPVLAAPARALAGARPPLP